MLMHLSLKSKLYQSSQRLISFLIPVAVSILILFSLNINAFSAQVTLCWDPHPDPGLAGYKVYYGTASRVYESTIDVGNVTTYTLIGLPQGETFFISVTAYDMWDRESKYSNEVSIIAKGPTQTHTVTTSPSGLQMTVDGVPYTAPQAFRWTVGSTHTVSVSSLQAGGFGNRYVYSSWSDGGEQSHAIIGPSSSSDYTAFFSAEYSLTVSLQPPEGGVVTPPGTNWHESGQTVSVTAVANPGYRFSGWSGDLSGALHLTSITINGPNNIIGNFTQNQYGLAVNINPVGSGSVTKNPNKATYTYGEQVTLAATANAGYSLRCWSGDAFGSANPITITVKDNTMATVNFNAIPGFLSVTPSEGLISSGNAGGPFSPSSQTYTLQNTGGNEINWNASKEHSWVSLSNSDGSLPPGKSTNVVVSINQFAKRLMVGTHTDVITFNNMTNGKGGASLWVGLTVSEPFDTNTEANTNVSSMDGLWIFEMSMLDKGGAAVWFINNTLYGYGISLKNGMFEIEGSYDINSKGAVKGTYTVYEFESLVELGRGHFTGKAGKNVTILKLRMNTMDEEPLPIYLKGSRFKEEPVIPADCVAKITGKRKGTLGSLKIEPYHLDGEIYPHVFKVSGPGLLSKMGSIEMQGYFFLTLTSRVYGVYQFSGVESEIGVFSGKLNSPLKIFNFNVRNEKESNGDLTLLNR